MPRKTCPWKSHFGGGTKIIILLYFILLHLIHSIHFLINSSAGAAAHGEKAHTYCMPQCLLCCRK